MRPTDALQNIITTYKDEDAFVTAYTIAILVMQTHPTSTSPADSFLKQPEQLTETVNRSLRKAGGFFHRNDVDLQLVLTTWSTTTFEGVHHPHPSEPAGSCRAVL